MPPSSPLGGRLRSSTAPSLATARRPCRGASACRPWARGAAALRRGLVRLRLAVASIEGTDDAARVARRADRGAEIHHRLRIVAGALLRHQFGGAHVDLGLQSGSGVVDRIEPRDHALDIAVDGGSRMIEGDRADRRRGVGPDAGQRQERRLVLREGAGMAFDHGACAGVQVTGACVVAESCPGRKHVVERRTRPAPRRSASASQSGESSRRRWPPWSAAA